VIFHVIFFTEKREIIYCFSRQYLSNTSYVCIQAGQNIVKRNAVAWSAGIALCKRDEATLSPLHFIVSRTITSISQGVSYL
jgi:hypothetical protein